MTYLNQDEIKALLAAPSARHRLGLRDRALLTLLYNTGARADAPLFLNAHGERITRFGVGTILKRNVTAAATTLPSLAAKSVSPHTLRHYVDGWVMWPPAASPLVAEPRVLVPAT